MTKPLQNFSVIAPGSRGINTQDSSVALENGFALEAWNCVIDKEGRLASRKGFFLRSAANVALGSNTIKAVHEFVQSDGTVQYVSAGNNKLFKGLDTLTEVTPAAYTITDSNWVFADLNSRCYLLQHGQEPLIFADTGSGYVMTKMTSFVGYNPPSIGINWNNVRTGISALGRLWCATDTTVYFSDLRNGFVWNTGTSGSLQLTDVWPDGTDTVQALAVHNNFLIIFGKRSILVYNNANVPANLSLADTVVGTGCISQQTIQSIGTDLLFVSENGLRSFARVVQEKSMPMRDISKNVRDDFLTVVLSEVADRLRSVYYERDAFYLLMCPATKQVWCFDTRGALQDGSLRVTRWDKITFTSMAASRDRKLYLGVAGGIAEYSSYLDGTVKYTMKYRSTHFDMGSANMTVIPKKYSLIATTSKNQNFVFKWGFDYSSSLDSESVRFDADTVISEYGSALYGVSLYSGGDALGEVVVSPGGYGSILQVGFDTDIEGSRVAVQKFSVYVKPGRIN